MHVELADLQDRPHSAQVKLHFLQKTWNLPACRWFFEWKYEFCRRHLQCLNFHCKHIYGFRRVHMAERSKNTLSYWLAQLIFWVWFSGWDSTGLWRSHHWGFIGGSCGQPRWFEHRLLHGDKTAALLPAEAPEFQHTHSATAVCHGQPKHFWCFLLFCLVWYPACAVQL